MASFDRNRSPTHIKRIPSPTDYDRLGSEHARKKYISEQFARDIAALSLGNEPAQRQQGGWLPSSAEAVMADATVSLPQSATQYPELNESPPKDRDLHVQVEKTALVSTHVNGAVLPMEQKGTDGELVIPTFILRNPM